MNFDKYNKEEEARRAEKLRKKPAKSMKHR